VEGANSEIPAEESSKERKKAMRKKVTKLIDRATQLERSVLLS